ncbi:pyrophosphatase PpaX [Moorella thermoacetica]|uniref:Pyrophosphatase PpaX n=1 Tax=Neomoorella thermoacetica TaxID=1525 RepID=A0A1J5NS73_NEOTH|nr:pyrophosphatase PpaX [Moorella thermoacetica]
MFAGVLFDFDGTLVDTSDLVIKSFQHTLAPYLGREVTPEEVYPYFGVPLKDGLAAFVPERLAEMLPVYRRFSAENFDSLVRLCPGVREGLERLRQAGIKLGVVTSRLRDSTVYGLKLFDLTSFFPVIICAEDVTSHKPEPEPVRRGLELLGVEAGAAAMIGDSPHDIQAARAAGVTSVAAGWSRVPREQIQAADPEIIVDTMAEFVELCLDGYKRGRLAGDG